MMNFFAGLWASWLLGSAGRALAEGDRHGARRSYSRILRIGLRSPVPQGAWMVACVRLTQITDIADTQEARLVSDSEALFNHDQATRARYLALKTDLDAPERRVW